MRLDKFLAHAELGSRKEVKMMIRKKKSTCQSSDCNKR